jgi:tripartite-type tricarboxylate transporter receptor subunit TctC
LSALTRRGLFPVAFAVLAAPSVLAQSQPVSLMVPWAAASTPDLLARSLARLLERELQQPVNVVNRGGSSGLVGHTALSLAQPDGQTIGIVTPELALHRANLASDIGADSVQALALLGRVPAGLVVRANADWRTPGDLVAAIRQAPGRIRFGGGPANGFQAAFLGAFLRGLGLEPSAVTFTPTPTAARAFQDLAGGTLDAVLAPLSDAGPLVENNSLRVLAIADRARLRRLEAVPTLVETFASLELPDPVMGVAGPPGMAPGVVDTMGRALSRTLASPTWEEVAGSRDLMGPAGTGAQLTTALQAVERALAPQRFR